MGKTLTAKGTNVKSKSITLAPLAFNEAVVATLSTGKAPPLPKKGAGKASKADKAAWAKIDKGPKPLPKKPKPKGKK